MSGAALVQFAKSLSPRFNLHFSFCSRSKKQTEPNDRNERGEAPRHPEDDSERGCRAEGVPHSLSPDSPSASSNSSTRSSSQSDQPSPLNQLHSNAINSPVAACLNTGVALCRSDSSASSSSSTSTIWVPSPWDGHMHSAAPACSYPPGQQALVPLPPSSQPFPADSQIAGTHVDRSPTPAPSAFDTDCSCPICLDPISNADLEPLTGCEHILHTHCLRDLLLHAQADCLLPARCPVPACRADILDPDIRRVLAPPAYSSYRTAEWRYYVDSHPAEFVRCPTANCSYVFAWNEAEYMAAPHSALCPECQHAYCLRCRCNWHPRASCEESGGRAQDWQRTERVLSGLGFRRCRQCRHWVEKSSGCNKITCRCGYRFCHKCGSENAKCNCSSIFHVFYPHYMVLSNWK